jgi:hypothetical protein
MKKFDGLSMEADIVSNDLGTELFQKKHVANIKWTPGKATVGAGMGKAMYKWIQASFDKGQFPQDGAVVSADNNGKAATHLDFYGAIVTSVAFPKLDGSSKDSIYLDVEFDPEEVQWKPAGGEDINATGGAKHKAWLCSNFRFDIKDLPCDKVASVDAMTWKCSVTSDQVGIFRTHTKHAGKVTVPDVKISLSMADFDRWADHAKKWFLVGEHLEGNEMEGAITLYKPDMKESVGSIDLKNLGFKKFSKQTFEANSEKIARFDVEFYCEGMKLNLDYTDA